MYYYIKFLIYNIPHINLIENDVEINNSGADILTELSRRVVDVGTSSGMDARWMES